MGTTKKTKTNPDVMDVVGYRMRGVVIDAVIIRRQTVSRGRFAGMTRYHLAPMERTGRAYGFSVIETYFLEPTRKYTVDQARAAFDAYFKTEAKVDDQKDKRDQRRRDALAKVDIEVGDEVLVSYREGKVWETVAGVNERTGKIGIVLRIKGEAAGSPSFARDIESFLGFPVKRRRDVRWIAASFVVEVKKQGKAVTR
jgi:hypothetical protein